MKSILILAFSDLKHDARVSRQVNFLKEHYQLTVVCFDALPQPGVEVIITKRIKPTWQQKMIGAIALLTKRYEQAYRIIYEDKSIQEKLADRQFDLIIANDIESLPLAFQLKKHAKIIFDAHEYAPRHFEDKLTWRIFFQGFNTYLCRQYLTQTDAMTTVGQGLADEYHRNFGVNPVVLTNANYYFDLKPQPTGSTIKLIHHGGANPSRRLEIMIDMMKYVDVRFTLDLMLITPSIANQATRNYLDHLKRLIGSTSRIKIVPPVKSHEVVDFIKNYDVGVFLIPPINFNYENTLPNKLFDFIQARLAIAIGPTPEMERLVTKHHLGVVSSDFTAQSLGEAIGQLTREKIDEYKANSHAAAALLNAEENKKSLLSMVQRLLTNNPS